jgi:hypothetical protein
MKEAINAFVKMNEEAIDLWLPNEKVPEVDVRDMTPMIFLREYVARNIPIIIRGVLSYLIQAAVRNGRQFSDGLGTIWRKR